MSSVYIPDFSEIMAVASSRGDASEAPELWNELVGGWPIAAAGGDQAYDVSGYGNHGTLTNMDPATDWVPTEMGWALELNGVNQYVTFPELSLTTELSFSVWAYHANTALETIFGFGYDVTEWVVFAVDDTTIQFRLNNWSNSGTTASMANRWVHIAGTWRSGELSRLYLDGKLAGTAGPITATLPASSAYRLGDTDDRDYPWEGKLTDLALWPRPLSPQEIQQLYADPHAMYRPRSRVFAAAVAEGFLSRKAQIIGGGICA